MSSFVEKRKRFLFLGVILLFSLLLVGSKSREQAVSTPSPQVQAAITMLDCTTSAIQEEYRQEWQNAVASNPLLLLRINTARIETCR